MIPAGLRRWLEGGRPGIKVCGVTREKDALAAIGAGVDALGFNFYSGSKRCVCWAEVAPWIGELPAHIGRVAVVVQAGDDLLRELRESGLFHAIQFHGGEAPETCARRGGDFYVKSCPISDEASAAAALCDPAPCLLLDAHAPGTFGGTGRVIDWSLAARVTQQARRPVVLSGGLHPENAAAAIAQVRPAAIDVASGVESAPGIKDLAKMTALVEAVRAVS